MVIGPYGRQWIHPSATLAFTPRLLLADKCCIEGNTAKSLELYQVEAACNSIAKRRLNIARKQLIGMVNSPDPDVDLCRIRIGFVDWYSGFSEHISLFLDIFRNAGLTTSVVPAEEADLLVAGCYGNRIIEDPLLSSDKLVLFLTGENISPSYNIHDFSLSTRVNSYCGKNARLPQWLLELVVRDGQVIFRDYAKQCFRSHPSRDLFVTAIYNNSTAEREEMLCSLRNAFGFEKIHVFGSQRTGEINKYEILSRSVINLCFENSLGNGYITEKLLHAKMMGCKALYWGDAYYSQDFCTKDVFNFQEIPSIDSAIDWCRKQIQDVALPPQNWGVLDHSLFARQPTYQQIEQSISEWSKLILAWRSVPTAQR